jgi:hypothetical protein
VLVFFVKKTDETLENHLKVSGYFTVFAPCFMGLVYLRRWHAICYVKLRQFWHQKGFTLMLRKTLLAAAVILSSTATAQAGVITNTSDILTSADHQQLSEWLGDDFDLTRIFAKGIDGDTAQDWHGIVDNRGGTFTAMEVFNGDERRVIGGYSTYSWRSYGEWFSAVDMGSYLFNLTSGIQYKKNSSNNVQAYYANDLIAFGGGADLVITGSLSGGFTNIGYSYGDNTKNDSDAYRAEFAGSKSAWTIGKFETFTLSASTGDFASNEIGDVPVPFIFSGLGLLGLALTRRNKRR